MFKFARIFRFGITGTVSLGQKTVNRDFPGFNEEAIVDEPIYPYRLGRVYFQNTWWPARCEEVITLESGEIVYVVGMHNITLLVSPTPLESIQD
ncbi:MAG: NfeD family protein [Actinomycetota bacterium]